MASNSPNSNPLSNLTFLEHVWEEVSKTDCTSLTVVLPSNRACGVLKQIAKQQSKSTTLLPEITTLEAFSNQLIPGKKGHPLELLQLLYKAYRNILGEEGHSFEQYLPLGEQMLADFNEIDLHLVDTHNFFQSLRNIKELESFQFDHLESSQVAYDLFWQQLGKIYSEFHQLLDGAARYYTGKKFRWLSENQVSLSGSVMFAGFSVLSPAEQGFIAPLLDQGKLILEYDSSFEAISQHESLLARPKIWDTKRDTLFKTRFIDTAEQITAHRCQDNQHQMAAVVAEIKKLGPIEQNQCCVIVPDASFAPTLVAALTNENIPANTTTGVGLEGSVWFGYLQHVQKALRTADSNRLVADMVQLLAQDPNQRTSSTVLRKILALKQQYGYLIPADVLHQHVAEEHPLHLLIQLVNTPWTEATAVVLQWLMAHTQGHGVYNATLIAQFQEAATTVKEHWSEFPPQQLPVHIWLDEVLKIVQQASIPVRGDAHTGIQVMGMLEVRSLDFKHVLVCHVNEGTLPANVSTESLIPADLRLYAKLPTATKKEALYGYYFYRLFYRAQRVHLFYLEDKDIEPSRYLHQLALELPMYSTHLSLETSSSKMDFRLSDPPENEGIILSDVLQERIISYLTTEGLSPSALCDLVDCPKKFLLETVLRSPEIEDYDNLPNHLLGNVLHNTLERVYEKYCAQGETTLTPQDNQVLYNSALALYPSVLSETFGKESMASNYILQQQIVGHLKRWFAFEKTLLQKHKNVSIVAVEQHLKTTINIRVGDQDVPVIFKGLIDRVHRLDESLEIVDYKAGKVVTTNVRGKLDTFFTNVERRYGLQLLSYQYLWERNFGSLIQARIFSFVKHQDLDLTVGITDLQGNFKEAFEQKVTDLLASLFTNPSIKHNPKARYCGLCE